MKISNRIFENIRLTEDPDYPEEDRPWEEFGYESEEDYEDARIDHEIQADRDRRAEEGDLTPHDELNEETDNSTAMEAAQYLFEEGGTEYFPDYNEFNDYTMEISKADFNKAVKIASKALEVLEAHKYYDHENHNGAFLELNDNHTIWQLEDYDMPFDDEGYTLYVQDAAEDFENRTGTELLFLGRSARHVCVNPTLENCLRYDELRAIQEELEERVINAYNEAQKRWAEESKAEEDEVSDSMNESEEVSSNLTLAQYADNNSGEIDVDVSDTDVDMTVAFCYNTANVPEDEYDKFIEKLALNVKIDKVIESRYGDSLVCDFGSYFKPFNEQWKEFFDMDNSEFSEDEAYYEAVYNLEALISGFAGEKTYKAINDILDGKTNINESTDITAEVVYHDEDGTRDFTAGKLSDGRYFLIGQQEQIVVSDKDLPSLAKKDMDDYYYDEDGDRDFISALETGTTLDRNSDLAKTIINVSREYLDDGCYLLQEPDTVVSTEIKEDVAVDEDPDLNKEQVNADVDYWSDVDEANTEDVSNATPIGTYNISNNSAILIYQIEYDINDKVLAGDTSDTTKAKWRDIIYEPTDNDEIDAYFYYGDIKVPFNEILREQVNAGLNESVNINELAEFIKDSVRKLLGSDYTNCKYNLDDQLAVFVGWSGGYDAEETNDYEIHSKTDPSYCINAAIRVRNEADWSDLDSLNAPYYKNDGEVYDCDYTISPKSNYEALASTLLDTYKNIRELLEAGDLTLE